MLMLFILPEPGENDRCYKQYVHKCVTLIIIWIQLNAVRINTKNKHSMKMLNNNSLMVIFAWEKWRKIYRFSLLTSFCIATHSMCC